MNLTSCDSCGVVLDKDKLDFSEDIDNSDGSVNIGKAAWNGDEYVPMIPCPVCNRDILKSK